MRLGLRRRRRWRDEPFEDEDAGEVWTVKLTIGHRVNVPMEIEGVHGEADCVTTVKAWLANLDEDGSSPTGWDGWLEVDYVENGAWCRLCFRPELVEGFSVSRGPVDRW